MGERIEIRQDERVGHSERPTVAQFLLQRRIVLGVVIALLSIGILLLASGAATSATVPNLLGERVDPHLERVRLQLAAVGLVLNDVSTAPCPSVDVPGASLEELPGTIIDQHPAPGEEVAASGAVDVTVCFPA